MDLAARRSTARLIHRVGFGPRPGEYQSLLEKGFAKAATEYLDAPQPTYGDLLSELKIELLGPRPRPNTPEIVDYAQAKRFQFRTISLWWLDQMVLQDAPVIERMTWFWHGHWATSFVKVDEPILIFDHVAKLRRHALGDFHAMCREMVLDPALILWLDGQLNTSRAPNENLSRELMELFILGVNRYSEDDVKALAKGLTGYKVNRNTGEVTRNRRQSHSGSITLLGQTRSADAESLAEFLVGQPSCQRFIPERLWYRFVTSGSVLPENHQVQKAFASRDIKAALGALVLSPEFQMEGNTQVKPPLEWMVSVLRALQITPSKANQPDKILNHLTALGQRPYLPPNVGGWPADEAWLSAAATQNRIQAAQYLINQGDLSPISSIRQSERIEALANWLGISEFSSRTKLALSGAIRDPERLFLLAICSPEYVVSA